MLGGDDFGADGAGNDLADLSHHVDELPPGLHHQRRIGGDAVDQAGRGQFADLVDLSGIEKELHDVSVTRGKSSQIEVPADRAARYDAAPNRSPEVPPSLAHGIALRQQYTTCHRGGYRSPDWCVVAATPERRL